MDDKGGSRRYLVARAARYLGVAPWELEEQPESWLQDALGFEWAEGQAREYLAKRGP